MCENLLYWAGTFTGYSALSIALVLPPDGKLVTCDITADHVGDAEAWKEVIKLLLYWYYIVIILLFHHVERSYCYIVIIILLLCSYYLYY